MRTPPRILAVDDGPNNLEILKVRLEAAGYEVITAVDGEEALARVREFTPDLVLLDVLMPKLDGITVLKQLKKERPIASSQSFSSLQKRIPKTSFKASTLAETII